MSDLNQQTKFFYELTYDRVLMAVETSLGLRLTGKVFVHNSMENRVYELWIDHEADAINDFFKDEKKYKSLIVKFYRPGRWSLDQILEEHAFMGELVREEIAVVAPVPFLDGQTLHTMPEYGIHYAVFPKVIGQIVTEPSEDKLRILGRLLARMHNVGELRPMQHRLTLDVATYGYRNLQTLLESGRIPLNYEKAYEQAARAVCERVEPILMQKGLQRIHGDLHFGNILWNKDMPTLVDFDDALTGSVAQDLWLLIPGRDQFARDALRTLLSAYGSMRAFDYSTLREIEALRALRFIHFSAWIAKRWDDGAFKRSFPYFDTSEYWRNQVQDLWEQFEILATNDLWQIERPSWEAY